MNTLHVKTGDTVVVLSGKDKGKQGKVLSASPKHQTVIVEGINIAQRHTKPRRQGEEGGILPSLSPSGPARSCVSAPSARSPLASLTRSGQTVRR